jgi:hypothetical protein
MLFVGVDYLLSNIIENYFHNWFVNMVCRAILVEGKRPANPPLDTGPVA